MRALVILGLAALAACVAPVPAPAADDLEPLPRTRPGRPGSQVVLEVGLAMPGGDLGDDFNTTELGFGAGNGMELGFRWRFHLGAAVSVAPYFHFIDYDDHETHRYDPEEEETVEARIRSTVYSYGLEARFAPGSPERFWRPFVAVAAGVDRNRVEGWQKEFDKVFDRSVNSLGLSARIGARIDQFEISAVYRFNRFKTWRYFDTGVEQDYVWDAVVVRAGWILAF